MIFLKNKKNVLDLKLDFLIAIYIFCILVSELMGAKTFPIMELFGFKISGAVGMFLIPWVFSINDIIFEVFGKERSKNLAKVSIFIVFLLVLFSAFAIWLPPSSRFALTEDAYDTIFSQSIRISIASLIAIGISNLADISVFWRLKNKLNCYGLWFRNNVSNILAILLDTVIFMTLAFYSLEKSFNSNWFFLVGIIVPYWFLKTIMSTITTPFVYWGIKWLKKK
ncbi:MAG: queuosine precursor transporter [Candidatus Shapirobacteria bacterium]|nr:queuosine precursor transporter [Candidatus Shapirobacteria bacterium]